MISIAVNGAAGRMGSRILELAAAEPNTFKIAGAFEQEAGGKSLAIGGKIIPLEKLTAGSLKASGVLIDFSGPAGTLSALMEAEKAGWGIVVGTTGLDANVQKALERAAVKIPVVVSANMSVGVNVVVELLKLAANKLSGDFKVKMTEAHHIHKKDAPSGTALMLAKEIASTKRWDIADILKSIKVIREGEIVGDHTVLFDGPAESIEITHHAKSRDTFARGALTAARFAATLEPGRIYSMTDVLKG